MDELKPNMCQPVFMCGLLWSGQFDQCVHFVDQNGCCKYYDSDRLTDFICTSAVARMNALTVLRKSMLANNANAKVCPWKDYKGNEIRVGDILEHPRDKRQFRVCFNPSLKRPWRAEYLDNYQRLDLALQIGAKGQASKLDKEDSAD